MRRLFGAAAAACVLAWAGAAGAVTHIIDFEGYNVGDVISGPLSETPYPTMWVRGEIVAGATGKALKILPPLWNQSQNASFHLRSWITGDYHIPATQTGRIVYQPTLTTFDYLAPEPGSLTFVWHGASSAFALQGGAWSTLSPNYFVETTSWRGYTNLPYLLVDNLAFEDGYGVVPEPATWAMMIAGFGMAGSAIRRRRLVYA